MRQPLDSDQLEDLPLVLGETLDHVQDAPRVRAEAGGGAVGRGSNAGFRQGRGGGPFIQALGQVIELPAHVLVGQREESAYGRGAGLAQSREEPHHDVPEQLIRLQVCGWPCEPWVALVQERAT